MSGKYNELRFMSPDGPVIRQLNPMCAATARQHRAGADQATDWAADRAADLGRADFAIQRATSLASLANMANMANMAGRFHRGSLPTFPTKRFLPAFRPWTKRPTTPDAPLGRLLKKPSCLFHNLIMLGQSSRIIHGGLTQRLYNLFSTRLSGAACMVSRDGPHTDWPGTRTIAAMSCASSWKSGRRQDKPDCHCIFQHALYSGLQSGRSGTGAMTHAPKCVEKSHIAKTIHALPPYTCHSGPEALAVAVSVRAAGGPGHGTARRRL